MLAAARQRGHHHRCPACGEPILLEQKVERIANKSFHRSCARYEQKAR